MSARWGRVLAWTALLTGLAATYALWLHSQRVAESHVERVLAQRSALVSARLGEAFSTYAALLLAGRAWLVADPPRAQTAWREFADTLDFQRRSPGLRYLLFAVRETGPADGTSLTVRFAAPAPVDERTMSVLSGQPALRAVLRAAEASRTPAVSPLLRSDAAAPPQLAVALAARTGDADIDSGHMLAIVDLNALMQWVGAAAMDEVVVRVYDGEPASGRLMYRSPGESDPTRARTQAVAVEDRLWSVEVTPSTRLGGAMAEDASSAILIAGTAVSLLLFVSLLGLASGQARASLLALRMSDAARARARRFSELARHAPIGIFVADAVGGIRFVNERWRSLFGMSEADAAGDGWARAVHLQDRRRVVEAWHEAVRSHEPFQQDCRLVAQDREPMHVSLSALPERDEHGALVAWIGTCMDVTARRQAELALTRANEELEQRVRARTRQLEQANASLSCEIEERRRAERERGEILQRQAALLHSIPDMAWLKDRDLRFLAVNEQVATLLGVSGQEIVGRSDADFMPAEVAQRNREEDLQVLRTGHSLCLDEMGRYGTQRWYEVVKSPVLDDNGAVVGVAGVARDISERKRIEEALRASNARLHALADELRLRAQARTAMNELGGVLAGCSTLEAGRAVLAGKIGTLFPEGAGRLYWPAPDADTLLSAASWGGSPRSAERVCASQCRALREGRAHHAPAGQSAIGCTHVRPDPAVGAVCVPLRVSGTVTGLLYWEAAGPPSPGVDEALGAERDNAWRQWACSVGEYLELALYNIALRQSLQVQARHDPLTNLFNRRYMEEALERELRRAERTRRPMGVIMADLDHFKRYNDTFGHAAGDRLLVALAECLRANVRAADIVCRYGGEEFLVILPETSLELLTQRAEELRRAVAHRLSAVADVPEVTMSLGVALYPQHAQEAAGLVRAADDALYRAKRNGRDRVAIAEDRPSGFAQRPSRSSSSSSR